MPGYFSDGLEFVHLHVPSDQQDDSTLTLQSGGGGGCSRVLDGPGGGTNFL